MATIDITIHASVPGSVPISADGTITATNAETYDGQLTRPPILLEVGDTLIVRLINDLPFPTGIHWHGIELENYSDGTEVTQNEVPGGVAQTLGNGVPAGGTFLYKLNVPRPGIFWFHPHHHHSTNRVFRGQYGMIVVSETAVENTLIGANKLPDAASTHQLILSDVTVCKLAPTNNVQTYEEYNALPPLEQPEWLSGVNVQNGPAPKDLCELAPLDDEGNSGGAPFGLGQIPNNFRMMVMPGVPPTVEGQVVLTNGRNVGYRRGFPDNPGALDSSYISISAQPGQGLRFQILNAATTRYFRLRLTAPDGTLIHLIRVGGEGGILNDAIEEGGMLGAINSNYEQGEIL